MTTAAAVSLQFAHIPLAEIDPSPTNPRKTFANLDELAADFKLHGVLQPLIVRAHGKRYECVDGERRLRAARIAKLESLPAQVRELSDLEVLEIQIVSNAKRADVHPVEEAEAYRQLRDVHKLSVQEIAVKVGRPVGTVYERLKLCELAPDVRKAALAGELPASHAVLIARIPDKSLQVQALKSILAKGEESISYRDALALVHGSFMLRLADAPFDITDVQLVPKAGACAACPKRTGNQRELFADVKSPDVCTDPTCYAGKVDALWKLKVKQAEDAGQKVIEGAAAKRLFPSYGGGDTLAYDSPYKKLDDEEWTGDKRTSVKALLGKDAPPPVLARAPNGTIVELVPRSVVEKKIKELQPERPRDSYRDDSQAKFRKQQLLRGKVIAQGLALLVEKAEADKASRKLLGFVAEQLFHGGYHDGTTRAAKRRDIERDQLEKDIPKMTDEGLAGLIVEIVAGQDAAYGFSGSGYGGGFARACKVFGVDHKKLEEKIKAEAKAKRAAKKPTPRVKKLEPKAAKAKKGKKK